MTAEYEDFQEVVTIVLLGTSPEIKGLGPIFQKKLNYFETTKSILDLKISLDRTHQNLKLCLKDNSL